jgi:hypothetical protein
MLSALSGVVLFGAGGAGLWYFTPRNGVPHRITTTPLLDTLVPIGIVALLAVGAALFIAGLAG